MLRALPHDVWSTLKSFRRTPAFVAVAVLTIGLGIGATTLVFSVVYGVLLRPLPYRDADRIVNVWNHLVEERQDLPVVHPADFRDYQAMSETFEEFAAASGAGHFRATVVSARFEGLSRVARQRLVYDVLAAEMRSEIHALALRTLTPAEWAAEA